MAKVDANPFPKVIFVEGAAPGTPASGLVYCYAKADGLMYSKDDAGVETLMSGGAGGGGGVSENLLPWQIDIDGFATGITQTNWNTYTADATTIAGFYRGSSGAQNDELGWDLVLAAGTWTVECRYLTTSDAGIINVLFDGVTKGTIDTYAGSAARNVRGSVTGITVATSAKIRVLLKMATKNASSSNYKCYFSGIQLRRTA